MFFIKYIVVLAVLEIIYLVIPNIIEISFIAHTMFILNIISTWFIIKQIEKKYYQKYNKISSMLYNLCPILGITLLLLIVYYFSKLEAYLYLLIYYLVLFSGVLCLNLIYIIANRNK